MSNRSVAGVIRTEHQLEGAGFRVRRPFPTARVDHIDPFLLLDEMGPMDYGPGEAVGAPDHPHRGFETVSYILAGGMLHEDSVGNRAMIGPGDVQWMTAGDGVVHSELPDPQILREGGRMHGFQLWVNLPARDKRMAPRYQEIRADAIPTGRTADGLVVVRVLAGESLGVSAAIDTRTPILYLHVEIAPGGRMTQTVPQHFNLFAYVFDGAARVGSTEAASGECVVMRRDGDQIELSVDAGATEGARILLLGGEPLGEPVARYGPFVMNSREELIEAFEDYEAGRLGRINR